MLTNKVHACVTLIENPQEPLFIDGIRADGNYDKKHDIFSFYPNSRKMEMDARWNYRVMVSHIIRSFNGDNTPLEFNSETERIEIYEHYPSVARDGPIASSDDLDRVGRIGKIGTLKTTNTWNLFAIIVPKFSLSVRVFDHRVTETGMCFIKIESDFPGRRDAISVSDIAVAASRKIPAISHLTSGEYRLVEVSKCEIIQIYTSNDVLDLEAALVNTENVLYDHIRLEPVSMTGPVHATVCHMDKQTGERFGYPFDIYFEPTLTAKQVKNQIQEKLCVSEIFFNKWRLCLGNGHHLKDDERVVENGEVKNVKLVLEHARHPNPAALVGTVLEKSLAHAGAGGGHKPLTIR